MSFNSNPPFDFTADIFRLLDQEWMLITAGNINDFNTMTASWGGFGILWNKPVCFIFIRPTRYTYLFTERFSGFTLSFFPEKYRHALKICGTLSGRDSDKVKQSGLSVITTESGTVTFSEARLVMDCKKLYFGDINPGHFLDPVIDKNYPKKDYHRMYIGEILSLHQQ